MKTASPEVRLSDEELAQMLELVRSSDSVELKLTIPQAHRRATVQALELDPLDAQIRQVFFFDTPDLALNEVGIVARGRRRQGKGDDSVIKLRPVAPDELPDGLRKSPNLTVEVDAMPGGYVCSATIKARMDSPCVKEAIHGGRPLRKLFTKEQRSFFDTHAPAGIELDDLTVMGPIFVLKLKFMPKGLASEMVAELWLYPDGSRILELSRKCAPEIAFDAAVETRAFLTSQGVDLSGIQETKTKTALEFFSGELQSQA